MDATRTSDGAFVMMKRIEKSEMPHEVDISMFFSSPELAEDSHNHCVPILETFEFPDDFGHQIIVMPLLRPFWDPLFDTVGEGVEFIRQLLEVSNDIRVRRFIATHVVSGSAVYASTPRSSSVS